MFSWANSQLEKLSETLAPPPTTPGPRFLAALAAFDENTALSILNDQNPVNALDIYTPVKPNGICPIHVAATYGAVTVLRELIVNRGVSVDTLDQSGYTPLHHAASTKLINANVSLQVAKFLVEECGASVITKSQQQQQTPYDVASSQAVRGYLLPKQLQAETALEEERAKLEGNHPSQIAPPPTLMGPGGMQQPQQQQGGGISAVDMLMQPSVPTNNAVGVQNNVPLPSQMNMNAPPQMQMNAAVQQQPQQMMSPQPPAINTPAATTIMESPAAIATINTQQQQVQPLPSLGGLPPPPNMASTMQSPVKQVAPNDTIQVNNQMGGQIASTPTAVAQSNSNNSSTHSTPLSTPRDPTNIGAPSPSPAASSQSNSSIPVPPSSGGRQHAYARRGGNSNKAAVLQNAKYKPDGFHTSSNDKELQAKYGHVNVVSNVAPPPISGGGGSSSFAPSSGNSSAGVGVVMPPAPVSGGGGGANPFSAAAANPFSAAGSRPPSSAGSGRYVGGGASRYPSYCAVSDSVSLIHSNSAPNSGGMVMPGAMQQQPQVPQYATFNHGAATNNNFIAPNSSSFNNAPASNMQQQTTGVSPYQSPPPFTNAVPTNNSMHQQQVPTPYQSQQPSVNITMQQPQPSYPHQPSPSPYDPGATNTMQTTPKQEQVQHHQSSAAEAFQQLPMISSSTAVVETNHTPTMDAGQLFNAPATADAMKYNGADTTPAGQSTIDDNDKPNTTEQPQVLNEEQTATPLEENDTGADDAAADGHDNDITTEGSGELAGEMQNITL